MKSGGGFLCLSKALECIFKDKVLIKKYQEIIENVVKNRISAKKILKA